MVNYAYAVGRLRAIEAHMLDESHLIRMVEAPGFEEAFLTLADTPYAEKIDKLEVAFDFETLLKLELLTAKELLLNLAPQNEILGIMFKKYEMENQSDEAYLAELNRIAQKHRFPLFTQYVQGYTLLNQLKIDLLKGQLDVEKALNQYRYSDFSRAAILGLEHYQKSSSLHVLEREIDNYLMEILKKAKYRVFGLEPLIGFAYAKEIETKLLRLILTGKLLQVRVEDIKERLRLSYV